VSLYQRRYDAQVGNPHFGARKPTRTAPCQCEWPLAAVDDDGDLRCVKCARTLVQRTAPAERREPPPAA
jgi:hypothetical protein